MLLGSPVSYPFFLPHSTLVSFGDTPNSCSAPHTILSHSSLPSSSVNKLSRPGGPQTMVENFATRLCSSRPPVSCISSPCCQSTLDVTLQRPSSFPCGPVRSCAVPTHTLLHREPEPVSHGCIHRALTHATAFALSVGQVVGPSV